ncbi:hypothetical protein PTKIN_Ptkin11bG0068600 [Pterospermum kingtungense]
MELAKRYLLSMDNALCVFCETLWLVRNDTIFNGSCPTFENVLDLCKYRLVIWSKARWPTIVVGVNDIARNPAWSVYLLKLGNISCSPLVNERDSAVRCKILFSKSIGVADSNFAELSVIKEAFKLFCSSKWAKNYNLEIESDSRNVVHWIFHPVRAPWRLREILVEVENLKKSVPHWPSSSAYDLVLRPASQSVPISWHMGSLPMPQ